MGGEIRVPGQEGCELRVGLGWENGGAGILTGGYVRHEDKGVAWWELCLQGQEWETLPVGVSYCSALGRKQQEMLIILSRQLSFWG